MADRSEGGVYPASCSGGFVLGGDKGLFFWHPEKPLRIDFIADPEPDLPDNRFNDGKCAPDGYLLAGTISTTKVAGSAALYALSPDLKLSKVVTGVTNSNGLAWSLDGKLCYYIDTPLRKVWLFDYQHGQLLNRRAVVDTQVIDASPDGMCMDAEGMLWIAFCHGGCVARFNPATGERMLQIDVPSRASTSVAFGGPDYDVLYVTSGQYSKAPHKDDGRVFAITGLSVGGLPAHTFAG
ncbi:MAG: SMP-30/gluconolactonase/LRE family protein [Verrucomicrobia bacterium]|nr:SMP-30/gluconolactonase/LRE family protein [Verrucomicrobiota bacterium]